MKYLTTAISNFSRALSCSVRLGFLTKLAAKIIEELRKSPGYFQRKAEVDTLIMSQASCAAVNEAKSQLSQYWRSLQRATLVSYQEQWERNRRDWKILTRGQEVTRDASKSDTVESLYQLIPERKRLARWMATETPLPPSDTWRAMADIYSLLTKDLSIPYLNGHNL